jgi:hypothetical protein
MLEMIRANRERFLLAAHDALNRRLLFARALSAKRAARIAKQAARIAGLEAEINYMRAEASKLSADTRVQ